MLLAGCRRPHSRRASQTAYFLTELSALAGHKDVAVYGIGRELPFTMSAWSEKMRLDIPLLSDATLSVAQVCACMAFCGSAFLWQPSDRFGLLAERGAPMPRSANAEPEKCCSCNLSRGVLKNEYALVVGCSLVIVEGSDYRVTRPRVHPSGLFL